MSPMIIRNHVIVGVSGDFDNLTGFLKSVDPETGATQWRWDSTPPVGTPNSTTGGMTWMTGTFDPDLDTLYWGTGQPDAGAHRVEPSGGKPLYLQHRRHRSEFRQAEMVFPGVAPMTRMTGMRWKRPSWWMRRLTVSRARC